ncbi:MAG: MMPL family transporter [Candidatus Alcyoniella australis]|nr:MMPL family transporter [Candidatus Alcyoniella australis]
MRYRIFDALAKLCSRRPLVVMLVSLAITAFFGVCASRLTINLGFLELLSDENPEVRRVIDVLESMGSMDYVFVVLTADEPATVRRFAHQLKPELLADPEIVNRVTFRVDTDFFLDHMLLYAQPDDLRELVDFLGRREPELRQTFSNLHLAPFVRGFAEILDREIVEENDIDDPQAAVDQLEGLQNFFELQHDYLRVGGRPEDADPGDALLRMFVGNGEDSAAMGDGYLDNEAGTTLMLMMMPSHPGDDYVFNTAVMRYIEQCVQRVSEQMPDRAVEVRIAGNIAVMSDEHQAIVHDMLLTSILSYVLVMLVFLIFFRRFSDLFLVGSALLQTLIWTFGITYLYIGYLCFTTAFFAAMLLGLGIDFSIHVVIRYGEELKRIMDTTGKIDVDRAMRRAITGAGPGVVTGGLTTAGAFLALMIARFQGIAQLGFVAGCGIIFTLIIMLTTLPASIAMRDHRFPPKIKARNLTDLLPLGRLARFITRHHRPTFVVLMAFSLVMLIFASQSKFNYNYRELEPLNSPGIKANDYVEEKFGRSVDYFISLFHFGCPDCVVQRSARIARYALSSPNLPPLMSWERNLLAAIEMHEQEQLFSQIKARAVELDQLPTISESESLSDYLPLEQGRKLAIARDAIEPLSRVNVLSRPDSDTQFLAQDTTALVSSLGYLRGEVQAILELAIIGSDWDVEDQARLTLAALDRLLGEVRAAEGDPLRLAGATAFQREIGDEAAALLGHLKASADGRPLRWSDLPPELVDQYVGFNGNVLFYSYPSQDVWNETFLKRIIREVKQVDENIVSTASIFLAIVTEVKQDFQSSVWLCVAAVIVLLLIDFRRLRTVMLALIPLAFGTLWMVGMLAFFHEQFNLANVSVVPMIIGIGVDNGVHMIHRYRMEKENRIEMAVTHTGRAIFLSSLTTMLCFGTIIFASYIALASLGQLLTIGIVCCFFSGVLFLPVMLKFIEGRWEI